MTQACYLAPDLNHKVCIKCGVEKHLEEFTKRKKYYLSYCNPCEKARKRESKLRIQYGIDEKDYKILENYSGRKCWICGYIPRENKVLNVDHCHTGLQVRGLLCHRCNSLLGTIKDDVEFLKRITNNIESYLSDNGFTVKELLDKVA